MCLVTHYPAAYALRNITAKSIVKALTQFITIFGITKIVQSDEGSNFSSHLFAQVLNQLNIKHNQASVYHAQSQGAFERFHQTIKSLLRSYCTELSKDWEEGLPWLLLAAREVCQESTGFSPNNLVFGRVEDCVDQVGSAQLMNRLVNGLKGCAVYLDDVVYSNTWDDHLKQIRALFDCLARGNLTLNLVKCDLATATVTYLGKVVGQGQVWPVMAKVTAVSQFPLLTTKKELMRFLGLVGYYRCFCRNFSSVVAPLTDLLKSKVKFIWSESCQQAFDGVKALLCFVQLLFCLLLGLISRSSLMLMLAM